VNEGGFRETVTSDTGRLVNPRIQAITDAVYEVSRDPGSFRNACIDQAKRFDISVFAEKMKAVVTRELKKA
jgi:hypothetical protein